MFEKTIRSYSLYCMAIGFIFNSLSRLPSDLLYKTPDPSERWMLGGIGVGYLLALSVLGWLMNKKQSALKEMVKADE